jgi:hypothetical protein
MNRTPSHHRITIMNPRGNPPPISLVPMAPRPSAIGKRPVYFVDVRFMNGDIFLRELQKALTVQNPTIKTEFRQKRGGYAEDDPALWKEIRENNGLLVMAIGH